jgi:hypothetical protein
LNIRILKNNEIDKIKWDSKLNESEIDFFFLNSWVWDLLHPEWNAIVINDYDSFMPIPFKKKLGLVYYFQPMFIREIPVYSKNESHNRSLLEFLEHTLKLVNLNFNSEIGNSKLQGKFQELIIDSNYDEIYKGYKTNTKRILKKNGLTISLKFDLSVDQFLSFFKSVKEEDIRHLKSAAVLRLVDFLNEVDKRNKAIIVGAYLNNELISAAYFIENKNTLYFMKGTSNLLGRKEGALFHIIDFMIKNKSKRITKIDFVGSNNNAIADFYKKFGATDVNYNIFKWNKLRGPLKYFVTMLMK